MHVLLNHGVERLAHSAYSVFASLALDLRALSPKPRPFQIHHLVFHTSFPSESISYLILCLADLCFGFVFGHHLPLLCQLMARLLLRAVPKPYLSKFYLWPRAFNKFFIPIVFMSLEGFQAIRRIMSASDG